MLVVAVVNLKGGSTKTTTAGFLCASYHESGLRVLGVDADGENQGLLSWQQDADLPWAVVGLPVSNLHTQLPGIAGNRYDVAVIDTPPMKVQRGTVTSAIRLADVVVVTCAPTHAEYTRLPAVVELLEESAGLRPDSAVPPWAILFTRCPGGAASPGVYRDRAKADGYPVLDAQVGRNEVYAQAQGSPIVRALKTPYGDASTELMNLMEGAAA